MRVAIAGAVGVPARYGGFETLAENLIRHHRVAGRKEEVSVYCSSVGSGRGASKFLDAELRYLPLRANGVSSILYDVFSLLDAVRRREDVVLLLGVSGALILPFLRLISRTRIVSNIDGIEWQREKWGKLTRAFLRLSEWVCVRFSHGTIADNEVIAQYLRRQYGVDPHMIEYGGDHAVAEAPADVSDLALPPRYALLLCRVEPENNLHVVLEAFSRHSDQSLVAVGNWSDSEYGRKLRLKFDATPNVRFLDPVYDASRVRAIRDRSWVYIHGHSAGGTNPALVEMMHFGVPVIAYRCEFNISTTESCACYFRDANELSRLLRQSTESTALEANGRAMLRIARKRYTWRRIGAAYFDVLQQVSYE